jgi:putative protease
MKKKLELISPGGSLEKIEYAYHYGADAVYAGLASFSLRSRLNEFTEAKLTKALKVARINKKKIYFTLNIYAHEQHLTILKKHLKFVAKAKPDAIIISDPGIIGLAKKITPQIKIHLSTQANTTNSEAVKFWQSQGISRIILAREVILSEIKKIRKACPKIELEYFVHGAMCMSYSGRCLLSRWIVRRGANLGDCVQPCRWPYRITHNGELGTRKEEKIFEVQEDEHGTYLLNSKDLCLIEYLDKLKKAGVNAFKIEGRTKSVYYVSAVTKAYCDIIEAINGKRSAKEIRGAIIKSKQELNKIINRGYSSGFLFGRNKWENEVKNSHAVSKWQFVGEVRSEEKINRVRPIELRQSRTCFAGFNRVKIHNVLKVGDKVEIITPCEVFSDIVRKIKNLEGESLSSAHGGKKNIFNLKFLRKYEVFALLINKI